MSATVPGVESRQTAPPRPKTPAWRQAFDAVERPLAAVSESWVQSDTFMDVLAVSYRLQKRLRGELHSGVRLWAGIWDVPTRSDVRQLVNQVASLERQVRELQRELEARRDD